MSDSPKPTRSRRRRVLKWVSFFVLGIAVLVGVALFFLPQIATKVIAQMAEGTDLERFEVTVVEVGWNEAVLTNLDAADTGLKARAGKVVVRYDPWDLMDGKVESLDLGELQIELMRPAAATEEETPAAEGDPFAWLHELPVTMASLPTITASGTEIIFPSGEENIKLNADLALRVQPSGDLELSLESEAHEVNVALKSEDSVSTLAVQLSATDLGAWLSKVESFLEITESYLPEEITLGPLEGQVEVQVTDKIEKIEISGSMTGLRYASVDSTIEAVSARTTFDGIILPDGESRVDLGGELSTFSLLNDAIPGRALALPKVARPTFATKVFWSADAFSYAGTLTNLQLHGGEDDQPLKITDGAASFSNQDALFQTDGNLQLNGLEVPFYFDLQPVEQSEGNSPDTNTKISVGPVTLDAPHSILAAFVPNVDLSSLTGTFRTDIDLRLTSDDPVSGTVAISITDANCHFADELVGIGPLTGNAQITLPADGSPADLAFTGDLNAFTLNTSETLGFPLTHRAGTPAEIKVTGKLASDSPSIGATISELSLEGTREGHELQLADTTLGIRYRGDELEASLASNLGATPLTGTYRHTLKELPDDQWDLQGKFTLAPTTIKEPITNAAVFSDALEGMTFSGTIGSDLEFQIGSNSGFTGALKFVLTDFEVALDDEVLVARGLSSAGEVTFPTDEESPATWQMEGTAKGLAIDTTDALGFPLSHDDITPVAFTVSGILDDAGTTKGSVSKLTLNGENRGEFVSFVDCSLDFRLEGESLSSVGRTTFSGNTIPFRYQHIRKVDDDGKWKLEGEVEIPTVSIEQAITSGGAFAEAAAGYSFTGKTEVRSTFTLGSDEEFNGTLDVSITDGSVTLPEDGPILSGIKTRFVTADFDTLHTEVADSFSIGSLTYGDLSFTKLSGRYQIHPNQDITLTGLKSSFLGGQVSIDRLTYPYDEKENYLIQPRFEGMDLETLTGLFPSFDGKLEGSIDGSLSIVRKDGVYQPDRGGIELTPPTKARLRYNAEGLFTAGLPPGSEAFKSNKLAEDSLKNLSVSILRGRLFDPADKDRAAVIRIEGQSPSIENAPPIHLNFNLFEPEGDFRVLVDYFFKNREKLNFGL